MMTRLCSIRLLLLLAMLFSATNASAQVCASLTLTTQAEVDAVNCSSVTGDVDISGPSITNLNGLDALTSVGGYLAILSNPLLTNVDGLGGITSVGGDLAIITNSVLTNLDGLDGITSVGSVVGGGLLIWYNPVLTNLDGLGAVTSVGGTLRINNNPMLTNLDGLDGLTSVGAYLNIFNNTVLTEFCGLFPLLDANGLSDTYTVTDNATNPTEAEILAGGACPLPPVPALGPIGIAFLLAALGATAYWRLRESAASA